MADQSDETLRLGALRPGPPGEVLTLESGLSRDEELRVHALLSTARIFFATHPVFPGDVVAFAKQLEAYLRGAE